MRRDLLAFVLIVLVACIAAAVVFAIGERGRQDQRAAPVAEIPPTALSTPRLQIDSTPTPTVSASPTPEFTATATPCIPPEAWVLYTVRPGNTLYSIAAWYGMTAEEIQQANCLSSVDEILAGQSLYVPWLVTPSPTPCFPPANWVLYTVQPGENLFQIAQRYGMSAVQFQQESCLASEQLMAGQRLYVPYLIPAPPMGGGGDTEPLVTSAPVDTIEGGGVLPPDLIGEVYFSPGGGIDPGCLECPGGVGPEISLQELDCLCLRGFPFDQEITVNLYAPSGDVYSGIFRVETEGDERVLIRTLPPMTDESQEAGSVWNEDGVRVIQIKLWGAASLPRGVWSAEASSIDAFDKDWTEVEDTNDSETISIAPEIGVNPFVGERSSIHTNCVFGPDDTCGNLYSPGDLVQISGTAFPPGTSQFLGVYYRESDSNRPAEMFYAKQVTTDNAGRFQTLVRLGSSLSSGIYWVTFGSPGCAPGGMGDECLYMGRRGCFEVR